MERKTDNQVEEYGGIDMEKRYRMSVGNWRNAVECCVKLKSKIYITVVRPALV